MTGVWLKRFALTRVDRWRVMQEVWRGKLKERGEVVFSFFFCPNMRWRKKAARLFSFGAFAARNAFRELLCSTLTGVVVVFPTLALILFAELFSHE